MRSGAPERPAPPCELAAGAPPRPVRSAPTAVHTDLFAQETDRAPLDDALARRPPVTRTISATAKQLATAFDRRGLDPDTVTFLNARLKSVTDRLTANAAAPILPLLALVDSGGARPSRERLRVLGDALNAPPDSVDLAALGTKLAKRPVQPVATAYDLAGASAEISTAFDPTIHRPSIVDRVLAGIGDTAGFVEGEPTLPVELTPELDLPAWQFLRDNASEWLLPGSGTILADSVIGLETNPGFVDAFLLGLNAQLVAELRFRNYPLIPGWAPVRTFWDRANAASGATEHDIAEIATWPPDTPFGSPAHQTPSASSRTSSSSSTRRCSASTPARSSTSCRRSAMPTARSTGRTGPTSPCASSPRSRDGSPPS